MASKKEPIEPLKSQYKILKDINQKLKCISDVYYISFENTIYLHSNVDFIEKICIINKDIDISCYSGIMYLPNELFIFTKEAKITKLTTTELQSSIILGQLEKEDVQIKLNRVYIPNDEIKEEDNIKVNIIPKMYSKFHNYFNNINELYFDVIDNVTISSIIKNNVITINDNDRVFSISKNLFSSLKKEDKLYYSILPKEVESENKMYVVYKEETDIMSIYTLCAYLNI